MDKECVYYVDRGGKVTRVVDDCPQAHHIACLPGTRRPSIVRDNGSNKVRAYDIQANSTVTNGRDFARMAEGQTLRRRWHDHRPVPETST